MNPKVSIIVPIYNVEKYLNRAIESLINQELKEIEIILIVDGSPDNSLEICNQYANNDNRIKVINKKNEGLGLTRNCGIAASTGEYIGFIDSDDYVSKEMYKTLYEKALSHNADCVLSGLKKEMPNGRYKYLRDFTDERFFTKNHLAKLGLEFIASAPREKKERNLQISVCRGLYKRKVIIDNNLAFHSEREYPSEDLIFQLDFFSVANNVIFIPNIFYTYCYNNTSLTQTYLPEKIKRMEKLYKLIKKKTLIQDSKSYRINKYFIGFCRAQVNLICSLKISITDKIDYLHNICTNATWLLASEEYPSKYLRLKNRIFYFLMKQHQYLLLITYSKLHNQIKKIK